MAVIWLTSGRDILVDENARAVEKHLIEARNRARGGESPFFEVSQNQTPILIRYSAVEAIRR